MKRSLFIGLLLACAVPATGQSTAHSSQMYAIALNKFIDQVDSYYNANLKEIDLSVIYLKDHLADLRDIITINGRKIVRLRYAADPYAANNNKLIQVDESVIELRGDKAFIAFTVIETEKEGEGIKITRSVATSIISFNFNCSLKQWDYEGAANKIIMQTHTY